MDRRNFFSLSIGAGIAATGGSSASEKAAPLSPAAIQERVERLRLISLFVGAAFDSETRGYILGWADPFKPERVEFTLTKTKDQTWGYYEMAERRWIHGVGELPE